jgi:zinc transport system substrate-binding protein
MLFNMQNFKRIVLFLIILIIISLIFLLIILQPKNKNFSNNKIAVTIYPFYDITKEIVGDKFDVFLILPPGADLHNFEPSPQDIIKLQNTKIIFSHGLIIDNWINNLTQNLKETKIIYLYEVVNLIDEDPHFWLSLENMKKISLKITEEIIKIDPQNKNYYEKNLENILTKLNELLEYAQNSSKNFSSKYIITQHNSFEYLAKELNLKIIGYLESSHKELTPNELKNLIDSIKKLNIKVIFKEPGEESIFLNNLAKEYNLKIYELDPIEGKSNLNYFDAYKKNIEILKDALNF